MHSSVLRGLLPALLLCAVPALAAETPGHDQAVGQVFHIAPDSLPAPGATPSVSAPPKAIARENRVPVAPPGFAVQLFTDGVSAPRRIEVGYDGVVYVAVQPRGGILALYDRSGEGVADQGAGVISGSANPFGLDSFRDGPLAGDMLLGEQQGIYRIPLNSGGDARLLTAAGAFGPPVGHVTRELAIDPKTRDVYVGVGSMANLDAGEPPMKATIQKFDQDGQHQQTFATGMRNVTGLAFAPSGALYAVTMERDGMGDGLVPDYFTRVEQGDDFGWPDQYIGGNVQPEFSGSGPKLKPAKVPDVLFEAHSAPLDVVFVPDSWPEPYRGSAIVALHGSWNAGAPRGYKLVLVPFKAGRPTGAYQNFLTGFWVSGDSPAEVWGRPCALAFDRDGTLLVGDDLGGTIWRVTPPNLLKAPADSAPADSAPSAPGSAPAAPPAPPSEPSSSAP
jgi:glucose/arabinose dehydrogenase